MASFVSASIPSNIFSGWVQIAIRWSDLEAITFSLPLKVLKKNSHKKLRQCSRDGVYAETVCRVLYNMLYLVIYMFIAYFPMYLWHFISAVISCVLSNLSSLSPIIFDLLSCTFCHLVCINIISVVGMFFRCYCGIYL